MNKKSKNIVVMMVVAVGVFWHNGAKVGQQAVGGSTNITINVPNVWLPLDGNVVLFNGGTACTYSIIEDTSGGNKTVTYYSY